jgi:hypothetical protein
MPMTRKRARLLRTIFEKTSEALPGPPPGARWRMGATETKELTRQGKDTARSQRRESPCLALGPSESDPCQSLRNARSSCAGSVCGCSATLPAPARSHSPCQTGVHCHMRASQAGEIERSRPLSLSGGETLQAKMSILNVTVPIAKIQAYGGPGASPAGHNFDLVATLKVTPRSMGGLSGEGIDCPQLEWKERIEWFDYKPMTGWYYVGDNNKDMFAHNPLSNTFAAWGQVRYLSAKYPPNPPVPGLAAITDEKEAKHWIAKNGLTWAIRITDVPAMGLTGGSGGGGGASLVIGNSRRRVIYFNLGFTGHPTRVRCVQVLETMNGALQIHKFMNQDVSKAQVDNPANLARWRTQVGAPNNLNF